MQFLSVPRHLQLHLSLILTMAALAGNPLDAAKMKKSSPYLLHEYWPVFMEPLSVAADGFPVIDILVDGKGTAYEMVSLLPVRDDEKSILINAAMMLNFAPGTIDGEGNPGFYRHPVQAYFVLDKADREQVTVAPVTKFRIPPSMVQAVVSAMAGGPDDSVEFIITVKADGKIQSISGTTKLEKHLATKVFSKLRKKMSFTPAEVDGETVPVTLHLHIHKQAGRLTKVVKQAVDVPPKTQRAPLRPGDGPFQPGKRHSVLLTLFNDGRVYDIQCLDTMTDSEVREAVNAFRYWRFKNKGGQHPEFRRVMVTYAYSEDAPKAEVLKVEVQGIPKGPRPLKRPSPQYPQ